MTTNIIIAVIVALLAIAFVAYKISTKGLRGAVVEFIVAAEQEFNKGQNSEKMEYVYNALVAVLPAPIRVFITKQLVINFIQKIFDEIKVALDAEPKKEENINE